MLPVPQSHAPASDPAAIRFTPAPADLQPWTRGAVAVHLPAGLAWSRFPASLGGMLVVRLQGQAWIERAQPLPTAGQARSALAEGATDATPLPPVALIGPSLQPLCFRQAGPLRACGLLLTPPAVALLAGCPNREVLGRVFDLDTLGPALGEALRARLAPAAGAATTDTAGSALLLDWLRERLARQPHGATAAHCGEAAALLPALANGLDAARQALGVGTRQLERRSLAVLGCTPKQAHAVLRLQAALFDALHPSAKGPTVPPAGADLALRHRYSDQSHLGRDLRRLAGAPLGAIVAAAGQAPRDALWAYAAGRQEAASLRSR